MFMVFTINIVNTINNTISGNVLIMLNTIKNIIELITINMVDTTYVVNILNVVTTT